MEDRGSDRTIVMIEGLTKTLLERIGLSNHYPTAGHCPPSNTKSMRCSMPGKCKSYSSLPLSCKILSTRATWSRITLWTLNMPFGHSSPPMSSSCSQNLNGNMSLQGQWSTFNLDVIDTTAVPIWSEQPHYKHHSID